jgi:hypothetical protein
MLISLFLYLLWAVGLGFGDTWDEYVLAMCYLLAVPFAIVSLWGSRTAFSITLAQLLKAGLAVVLASVVVFVSGRYFGIDTIDWVRPVPRYINILAISGFTYPQESSLILAWGSYVFVASLFLAISKVRPKTTNRSQQC